MPLARVSVSSLLGLLLACLCLFPSGSALADSPCNSSHSLLVSLPDRSGSLLGHSLAPTFMSCVDIWLGIPYAQPPVGKLRLRPPQRVVPWPGVRVASEFPVPCAQGGSAPSSEDCLYLNVFAPANRPANATLPVLVFIHGGSFVSGDSNRGGLYNGINWAANMQSLIIVTLQYRLGALGFLALEQLIDPTTKHPKDIGNYGLKDQRFALEWVQRNILAFGGDPNRVTLMGESAGAFSVLYHITNPFLYSNTDINTDTDPNSNTNTNTDTDTAAPLFHRVIIESGAPIQYQYFLSYNQSVTFSQEFTTQFLNCPVVGVNNQTAVLDCLQSLDTPVYLNAPMYLTPHYVTMIDQRQPLDFIAAGQWLKQYPTGYNSSSSASSNTTIWTPLPILWGTNRNESTNLFDLPHLSTQLIQYIQTVKMQYSNHSLEWYNITNPIQSSNLPLAIEFTVFYLTTIGLYPNNNQRLNSPYFPVKILPQLTPWIEKMLIQYSSLYPDYTPIDQLMQILNDQNFYCNSLAMGETIYKQRSKKAFKSVSTDLSLYMYYFAYNASDYSQYTQYSDFHGLELPYVFDRLIIFQHKDYLFSSQVQRYWTRFIHHGDPNQPIETKTQNGREPGVEFDDLQWPAFTPMSEGSNQLLLEHVPIDEIYVDPVAERCGLWTALWQQWNSLMFPFLEQ